MYPKSLTIGAALLGIVDLSLAQQFAFGQCLNSVKGAVSSTKQCQTTINQVYSKSGFTSNTNAGGCTNVATTGDCAILLCLGTDSVDWQVVAGAAQSVHAQCKSGGNTAGNAYIEDFGTSSGGTGGEIAVQLIHTSSGPASVPPEFVPFRRRDVPMDVPLPRLGPSRTRSILRREVHEREGEVPSLALEARAAKETVVVPNTPGSDKWTLIVDSQQNPGAELDAADEVTFENGLVTEWGPLADNFEPSVGVQQTFGSGSTVQSFSLAFYATNNNDLSSVPAPVRSPVVQALTNLRDALGSPRWLSVRLLSNGGAQGNFIWNIGPQVQLLTPAVFNG